MRIWNKIKKAQIGNMKRSRGNRLKLLACELRHKKQKINAFRLFLIINKQFLNHRKTEIRGEKNYIYKC